MAIKPSNTIPERFEKHAKKNWVDKSFNHKTTLTMGELIPMACKLVYPGELARLRCELMMRFAQLYLPIMHTCYFTWDWFYVRLGTLWQGNATSSFESFMKQDPITGPVTWPYIEYTLSDANFTDGILNYMGFNSPPSGGTLIFSTDPINAMPPAAYYQIWRWFFRNPNIQGDLWTALEPGDMSDIIDAMLPSLRVLRRNWPRDYYTVATLTPQLGSNVLIPSFATDEETGLYVGQKIFELDGGVPATSGLQVRPDGLFGQTAQPFVLQLSSTIRDFRYAAQMTEFLERHMRAGGQGNGMGILWSDFVKRNFDWDPNPLMIDKPVWIGGYTGDVIISDVMATAEAGGYSVGQYTGKAMVRDNTPEFMYTCPDYGYIIPILTVYPKASYYQGTDRLWTMETKMDYMWEQFALIGDQPMKNKEVWFSWYEADIAWNEEIFGYVPQYHWERHSTDIVSGQMRTLWESFHLGRKFTSAAGTALNPDFVTCTPDIGRVFNVDAEAGEHECYIHSYIGIEILRRLPRNGLPSL